MELYVLDSDVTVMSFRSVLQSAKHRDFILVVILSVFVAQQDKRLWNWIQNITMFCFSVVKQ